MTDPDEFPVGWHPHRGMDLCSYVISGKGRHADSMGNRGSFPTPGMQWLSAGSGIEHAEGGGTPVGEALEGFQIWINVPAHEKMKDPSYGTTTEPLPLMIPADGVTLRLLAGVAGTSAQEPQQEGDEGAALSGPFVTTAPVQMVDLMLAAGATYVHTVPAALDNCLVYVYRGAGWLAGEALAMHHVARLDATSADLRQFSLTAGPDGLAVLVCAGKRLDDPIAWRGPIVMNTQQELERAFSEYRSGKFLRKRTAWDYKRLAAFPDDFQPAHSGEL